MELIPTFIILMMSGSATFVGYEYLMNPEKYSPPITFILFTLVCVILMLLIENRWIKHNEKIIEETREADKKYLEALNELHKQWCGIIPPIDLMGEYGQLRREYQEAVKDFKEKAEQFKERS